MIKIFLETGATHTSEYLFFDYLLKKELNINSDNFIIVDVGGKDKLYNTTNLNALKRNTEEGGRNIVIFDADTPQNKGGFLNRKKEIEEKKEEYGIAFELFLLPNNSEDGYFETLLEKCVTPQKNQIIDCFNGFVKCIERHNENGEYNMPNDKSKIYSYIDTTNNAKRAEKDKKANFWQFDNKECWDFDCEYIKLLKDFLKETIY